MSEVKRCTNCGEDKPLTEYRKWHRECKRCLYLKKLASYVPIAERSPEDQTRIRRKNKANKLRHSFGIEIDVYDDLWAKQEGRCAICDENVVSASLDLDHCHKSGAVRGLLCRTCNLAIGWFNDDLDVLRSALDYLGGE